MSGKTAKAQRRERNTDTVALSGQERFDLLAVLPQESDILTMRTVRDLRTDLLPSDGELEAAGIEHKNGNYSLPVDKLGLMALSLPMTKVRRDIIEGELKKRADAKKVSLGVLALYERFVEGIEPERNGKTPLEADTSDAPEVTGDDS